MKEVKKDNIVLRLEKDVREWISMQNKKEDLITDERDLQVRLAIFLEKSGHYQCVFTEYRVPIDLLVDRMGWDPEAEKRGDIFPWNNDISVDIVVKSNEEYACVELKYATLPVEYDENVFGESTQGINIIKSQGATNSVMYHYWKDVRRIEALKEAFPKVMGGVALIITNNRIYWDPKSMKGTPKYKAFATFDENTVGPELAWGNNDDMSTSHPNMKLERSYQCHWHDTSIPIPTKGKRQDKFHYMINIVR